MDWVSAPEPYYIARLQHANTEVHFFSLMNEDLPIATKAEKQILSQGMSNHMKEAVKKRPSLDGAC